MFTSDCLGECFALCSKQSTDNQNVLKGKKMKKKNRGMYPEGSVSAMLYDKYLRKLMQSLKAIFPVVTIDYITPLFCI